MDGLAKIENLVKKAKELGQKCIAITDHGTSSGLAECKALSEKYDMHIILGEEFYYENPEDLKLGHLIILVKNTKGLENLFKLQRKAYDNFYYKPRINLEMLKECHEGLICTTACIANQVGQYILKKENHLALNHIMELKQIFQDDFYIELQSSTIPEVRYVNTVLEQMYKQYNLKPVITNDVHYVDKEDYDIHEVLLCIQQKGKMDSAKRWKFETNDFWLKSQKEIEEYLDYIEPETIKESYKNIEEIQRKCEVGLGLEEGNYLPTFLGDKEAEDDALNEKVWENYNKKLKDREERNKEFAQDLLKELDVISSTGYSGYFLIVNDYVNWAKENGIMVGDGRGSGAGSKVAYTIGITEVNPQKYDLLFERFLSPGREPDFDIDFSDIDAVFRYLQSKYGSDNVARVGAISRFTAKSAIRKVMGVYGFTQARIANIISVLPKRLSFTLQEALDESEELVEFMKENPKILRVVERLEGIMEHFSTHAGGVIICEGLTSKLPVMKDTDNKDKLVVALDKKVLEKLGHYKFDVLGLNSLSLMENITKYTGKVDWHKIDFEDENVYKMLSEGDVLGVFQLSEQKDKVMQQKPTCFEDLIAINALIRPGVCDWEEYLKRRHENEPSELQYMQCTHGLIVYQDQYLQLAQTYAGWDIAFSDKHIRKNKNILNDTELKEKFIEDGCNRMYEKSQLEELWNEIAGIVSQGYGFNRAHSTSYAMLSYQTAYMKLYRPTEFYAAYLTQNIDDTARIIEIINLLKQKKINIIKPHINDSTDEFIPKENGILFPLTVLKSVGGSAWAEIKKLRPIKNYQDFMDRRVKKFVKSTAIESLIKAGVFDEEGKSRYELLEEFKEGHERKPDYMYEKEAFGYYLSASPFDNFDLRKFESYQNGEKVTTVVEITNLSVRYDKRGNEMAFATGVNSTDVIRLVIFSSVWCRNKFNEEDLLIIKGTKEGGNIMVTYVEQLKE